MFEDPRKAYLYGAVAFNSFRVFMYIVFAAQTVKVKMTEKAWNNPPIRELGYEFCSKIRSFMLFRGVVAFWALSLPDSAHVRVLNSITFALDCYFMLVLLSNRDQGTAMRHRSILIPSVIQASITLLGFWFHYKWLTEDSALNPFGMNVFPLNFTNFYLLSAGLLHVIRFIRYFVFPKVVGSEMVSPEGWKDMGVREACEKCVGIMRMYTAYRICLCFWALYLPDVFSGTTKPLKYYFCLIQFLCDVYFLYRLMAYKTEPTTGSVMIHQNKAPEWLITGYLFAIGVLYQIYHYL